MTELQLPQPTTRQRRRSQRNRRAALVLVLLTPLIAELALGSTPVRMAWLVLLWVPIYGAGVLLIRELVTRRKRGWAGILLLAVAYELVEDGIGLQALTSPHLYGAAEWGLRVFGLNLPYWEANVVYHAVFSVVIPIALTDLLFPRHRGQPYLGRTGTVIAAVVMLFGVGILRVTVSVSQDPGYQAPLAFVVGTVVAVIILGSAALYFVRPSMTAAAIPSPVPSRTSLVAGAAVATLAFVALTFPMFGSRQPAFTRGSWVIVPMIAAAAIAVISLRIVRRMSQSSSWTDRHTLAVISGALVAHSIGGIVTVAHTTVDRLGLVVIIVLTGAAMLLLDRRLAKRSAPLAG